MAPTPESISAASEDTAGSVLDRVTSFVQAHKQAVLVGAALAVAAGGVAYYATTSSGGLGGTGSPGGSEAGDARRKKKKASHRKRKTGANEKEGPILEEVVPKSVDEGAAARHFFFAL